MDSSKKIVDGYLKLKDWRVKENSNRPFSYGAMNSYMGSEVAKDYWLREVYPQYIADAYVDGHIHIHDLGCLSLYCCGYSLKEILKKGVRGVQNIPVSGPAKHFDSVLNQIANLVTVYQNEIAGAVAFNSFDTLLAPFIKVDGLDYEGVVQNMQNFIYSVNSNSRAGAEPAFSNITFDLTPPEDLLDQKAIVGGKKTDFTYRECQKEMDMLNKAFCEIMLEGDAEGKLFAYPIPTYNIHKRFDWDNPNNDLLWEMAGKFGLPYFANFINSDMEIGDVRSMCPLAGSTEIIYYSDRLQKYCVSSIKEVYNHMNRDGRDTVKLLSKGKEIECRINKFDIPAEYEVELVNGAKFCTTANHLNKVYGKDYVETRFLTTEDYIPYSLTPFEKRKSMTYEEGKLVGMFLGDGSYSDDRTIVFSLNEEKKKHLIEFLESYAVDKLGAIVRSTVCYSEISGKPSCVNIYVNSKFVVGLIREFVEGNSAITKGISGKAYMQSIEFRRGILDGLYETDGGNNNRIYTSSETLRDDISTLCATLGMVTNITVDVRGGRLGELPCYTVRYYQPKERKGYKDVYKVDDEYLWVKIKEVRYKKHNSAAVSYCAEVVDEKEEPVFMLANGILTHNCRLRLDLRELRKKNGGLFGAGDATGSIGVVTINLPRLGYEHKGDKEGFFKALRHYLDIAKDSLEIKRKWLQENILDTNAIPAFMEYVGTMNNHFSVIGEVGANEMCENFMGKNILDPEAHAFVHEVHEFILDALKDYQEETGNLYAFEATPAEGTCYRFAMKDKSIYTDIITQGNGGDPYYTNSCHIPVKYIESIDKTFKHQEDLQVQFNSGTVIHIYLEGGITGEQAKSIIYNVCHNYKVPYVSLSPISRYCEDHGYIKEHVDECPICGKRLKKYQRITGYLRCVDNFNNGKAAEFRDRKQINI